MEIGAHPDRVEECTSTGKAKRHIAVRRMSGWCQMCGSTELPLYPLKVRQKASASKRGVFDASVDVVIANFSNCYVAVSMRDSSQRTQRDTMFPLPEPSVERYKYTM